MEYKGKVYGKINGKYIELTQTVEQFETSIKADLLDSYNDFLLKNGYCDTDIISEEPTALDQFLILDK